MKVKIGQNDRSTEINVPFLLRIQKINTTILRFKATKHLLQNKTDKETMVSILQTAFDNADKSKMNSLLILYNKVKGKNINIPAERLCM